MDKKISDLIIDLEKIFNDRLSSIILYGSAAFGEFHQNISDLNTMVVIDKLTAKDLKAAFPAISKWRKTKNPVPIFVDKEEMFRSCDVYAIEYSDIKEKHKILYGEDFLDELVIDRLDLRLQCEAELRNLIIKLRQSYLANSNDKKAIENMIKKSSTSILAIFRGILRLLNEDVPVSHREVLELLATRMEFDKDVFAEILLMRENKKPLNFNDSVNIIQRLINSLHDILELIDQIKKC